MDCCSCCWDNKVVPVVTGERYNGHFKMSWLMISNLLKAHSFQGLSLPVRFRLSGNWQPLVNRDILYLARVKKCDCLIYLCNRRSSTKRNYDCRRARQAKSHHENQVVWVWGNRHCSTTLQQITEFKWKDLWWRPFRYFEHSTIDRGAHKAQNVPQGRLSNFQIYQEWV